ncbi:hypothetical protein HA466_0309470 [Hirschfeldia incana]|nr:hypothetical protein HA466_0309470 [Hirschfeldia incana]KAJ0230289.1 hypothetical protein HA466_0309470 [Hirschfeldia incana]
MPNQSSLLLRSLPLSPLSQRDHSHYEIFTTGMSLFVKKVWVLCNDCNDTTQVYFHIIGQKCGHCRSYKTRAVAPPVLPR